MPREHVGFQKNLSSGRGLAASRGAIDDLKKIVSALLIADAIVVFNQALPASIDNLDVRTLAAVRAPLDAFAAKYPHAMPFALTIVASISRRHGS
jgi:hypothetical protein